MNKDKKVVSWIQNLVDTGILQYEDLGDGELAVTQGPNYKKAPQHFRTMFEETGHTIK